MDAKACLKNMKRAFEQLEEDYPLRKKCNEKEKQVVDGLGAKRIAQLLES